MAGIYIHIPYCRQACHYCNFHFSTGLNTLPQMTDAIGAEIAMRSTELNGQVIETIYFGGGTPSLLNRDQLNSLLNVIYRQFNVISSPEITIEINPDDVTAENTKMWLEAGINRISIGVQGFEPEALRWMNRSHNAVQSQLAIYTLADAGFENISMDLIYGLPQLSEAGWHQTLEKTIALPVQHVSAYCLTVEPKTALQHFVMNQKVTLPDEEATENQFMQMSKQLSDSGFVHYEISNFGLPGYFSQHNSSYWKGKPYAGFGPSAHSYNGKDIRRWNILSNQAYMRNMKEGKPFWETEILSEAEHYNEQIMTGLRTIWGCNLNEFTPTQKAIFTKQQKTIENLIQTGQIVIENNALKLTPQARFLADGIAASLFA